MLSSLQLRHLGDNAVFFFFLHKRVILPFFMRFLDSGCQGSLGHSLPQDTSLCVSWRETNIWSRKLEKELFFDGLSHNL